jgi:Arm DNA-binding domain
MALTDLKLRAAKPQPNTYHLTDGQGLFLVVQRNGSKLWRWKYRFQGNFRLMAFGSYPAVSLAQARAAHAAARAKLDKGIDPMAERKAGKTAELELKRNAEGKECDALNPSREVAAKWFMKWKVGKVDRHVLITQKRLNDDILSKIGNRPIAKIKPPEIAGMILAIEERGAEDVARRALQTTQQIFRYAMAFGLAEQNPAMAFRPSDILQQRVTTNFARVEVSALPENRQNRFIRNR